MAKNYKTTRVANCAYFTKDRNFSEKKNSKNLRKIQNFKLKNSAKSPIFNFFSFFLLQNGCNIIFFQLKISEWLYLVSLYFYCKNRRKWTFRGFFANCAKTDHQILISTPNSESARKNLLEPLYGVSGIFLTLKIITLCNPNLT